MGYAEYIKDILRPLRIYDLDSGYGAAEINTEGEKLDEVSAFLEAAETESIPATAIDYGLKSYEKLLPYRPYAQSVLQRRNALMALMRIDWSSFTLEALADTISGCGINATVQEADTAMSVQVSFPGTRGIPENIEKLQERIEQILPCHLDIMYHYFYIKWTQLETKFLSWTALESAGFTWEELEKYE